MKLVHFALPLALFLATEPVFSGDEFVDNIDEVTHAPTFESKLQQYLDSKVDEKKLWAFLASQKYMDNNGEMTSVPFAKDRGASEHELNLIVEAIDRIHHADLATIKFNNSFFGKIDNLFKGAHFATSTPEESQEAYTGQLLRYYIIAHRDDPIDVLEENLSEKGIDGNAIVAFHEKVKGITHDDRPVSPKRSPRIDAVSTQEDHSHPTRILPPKIPVPKLVAKKFISEVFKSNGVSEESSSTSPRNEEELSTPPHTPVKEQPKTAPSKFGASRLAFLSKDPESSPAPHKSEIPRRKISNPFEKKFQETEVSSESMDWMTQSLIGLPSEQNQKESFHPSADLTSSQPAQKESAFARTQRLAREAAAKKQKEEAEAERLAKEAKTKAIELKRKEAAAKREAERLAAEEEMRAAAAEKEAADVLATKEREAGLRHAREEAAAKIEAQDLEAAEKFKDELRKNSRKMAAEGKLKRNAIQSNPKFEKITTLLARGKGRPEKMNVDAAEQEMSTEVLESENASTMKEMLPQASELVPTPTAEDRVKQSLMMNALKQRLGSGVAEKNEPSTEEDPIKQEGTSTDSQKLTHLTKNRARAVKRNLPTRTPGSQQSEQLATGSFVEEDTKRFSESGEKNASVVIPPVTPLPLITPPVSPIINNSDVLGETEESTPTKENTFDDDTSIQ